MRVEILIVLYKTTPEKSLTLQSLCSSIKKLDADYSVLVYNNSPEIKIPDTKDYKVYTPKENVMLGGAYSYALSEAVANNREWLLLLDQDTELTDSYFKEINRFLSLENKDEYAAALPVLECNGKTISPFACSAKLGVFGKDRHRLTPERGEYLSAFNSATLLNVKAISSIGGFNKEFPLDMLDHWYFYKLYKAGYKTFVLSAKLNQQLSLLAGGMSKGRYLNYLDAEWKYAKVIGVAGVLMYKIRLVHRILTDTDKSHLKPCLKNIFRLW